MVHQCEGKLKELTDRTLDKLSSRLASKQRRLEEITTEYEKIKLKDIEIAKYNQSITEINNFNTKMNLILIS